MIFPFYVDFLKEEDCDLFVCVNHQMTNKNTAKMSFIIAALSRILSWDGQAWRLG